MDCHFFITHPGYEPIVPREGWLSFYNSREHHLSIGKGILNVKKEFSLEKAIKKAVIQSTALGVYRLYINGARVGTATGAGMVYDELKPGWTDYHHRVLFYEYDITEMLRSHNTVLAEIAPGWWSGHISYSTYGLKNWAFAAQITVEYADGSGEEISTDESWDAMVGGPVRYADIWDGQYYDALIPHPAVAPDFYRWDKATAYRDFHGVIEPNCAPPVRIRKHLCRMPEEAFLYEGAVDNGSDFGEVKVLSRASGAACEKALVKKGQALVLDFGQEMVGWPSITVLGEAGTEMEVFFSEMLNDSGSKARGNDGPKGSPYLENYRAALSRFVVKLAEGSQTHTPSLTFYGFRYIEFRATADIEIEGVTGLVIGSDLEETGTFSCDNEEVNRLYANVLWGMRGNYLSVPTDCPQRNERLGWTGDTQIFSGAASYLADIRSFMHNWLTDCRNSQIGFEGAYSDIVPRSAVIKKGGNAAWGDAGIIVPYRLYLMYNDREIIKAHYASMEWYMRYLERNGLNGPNPTYGDWLNYSHTEPEYISICYYAYDLSLMALFSRLLDKSERAEYYEQRREQVIAHWKNTYTKDGVLTISTQTAYLLPLAFDMVPDDWMDAFKETLRSLIEDNGCTLTTGFVGTGILCQTLDKLGMTDLCYSLLLQTKNPSWLYSVRQGATTVWERWDSYTLETGFNDVNMNSFNHYAYGAVAEWMYSGMCGICPDPEVPGFSQFILKPTPDTRTVLPAGQSRINRARASYQSVKGKIESGWAWAEGAYEYDFRIPENTQARVSILSGDSLTLNGSIQTKEELKAVREGQRLVFTLGAGKYHIRTE